MTKFKYILTSVLLVLLVQGCGSSKNVKKAKVATIDEKLSTEFNRYKGVKYKYGGTDKSGFDCSGFVGKVYTNAFNIQLPRTTKEIALKGKKVGKKNLKVGDLVFFKPTRRYNHVGIYVGDGYFMHSSTSKGVIKSKLDNVYWKKKYRQARRILKK